MTLLFLLLPSDLRGRVLFGRFEGGDRFAVGAVPDAQGSVEAAGDDQFAIRGDIPAGDEFAHPAEGADFVAIIADDSDSVVAGADQGFVGNADEMNRGEFLGLPFDGLALFAGGEVPNFYDFVGASAGDGAAIAFPTHALNVMSVPFKGLHLFAGG